MTVRDRPLRGPVQGWGTSVQGSMTFDRFIIVVLLLRPLRVRQDADRKIPTASP